MRLIKIILYMLLILIAVSFAALNAGSIEVNFYFTSLNLPIPVLLCIMLGLGFFIGLLSFFVKYWRLKIDLIKTRSQLHVMDKEIRNLRNIPLKDQH